MTAAQLTEELQANSFLRDGNLAYIEELYDAYLKDPDSISEYWRQQFDKVAATKGVAKKDIPLTDIRQKFIKLAKLNGHAYAYSSSDMLLQQHEVQLENLITAYRAYGHLQANLDPLEMEPRKSVPDLTLETHGFTLNDLNNVFHGFEIGNSGSTLGDIYKALQETYCGHIGTEFMHIADSGQVLWIQNKLESMHGHPRFSDENRKRIYRDITAADGLEKYLGTKYVGQKRFSLEGAISLIPMLDELAQRAGAIHVKELVIGMAHRGRLNVLVNILGKSPESLFKEFEGKSTFKGHSGDVKYHMGFSSNVETEGGPLHLILAFNPSHLEIIDPVVEGAVRARQTRWQDTTRVQVIPVLIHGDAAFAGQGVVAETFNFSQARGFSTGGTIHIVINNQIGFTTSNPLDARSTLYCTDVAKMVQAPVFHVNGDDPESCVFVTQLALEFRMKFKKDVIIDLVCYRKHGHNEADEPSGTQPLMYKKIKSHPSTLEIYTDQLIKEGMLSKEQAQEASEKYQKALDQGKTIVSVVAGEPPSLDLRIDWKKHKTQDWNEAVNTAVSLTRLKELGARFTTVPTDFKLQAQVAKEYEMRQKMVAGELPFNWGCAETMAYATLLTDGYAVRLSGQDSCRGTFSHRHALLHHMEDGSIYVPLSHLDKTQRTIELIDSILSEEAVLGFEYGFATTLPNTLVIWEAQFGDFANGAQVVIDQFISSGEQKWQRLCGLVMYLPHGYEGQGPEHSSARLERYLQLCAENNMQVCIPSTPAQLFHMLRRQMLRLFRKPLIVFTPKSLLRHKLAVSSLEDLANGQFQLVIPDIDNKDTKKIKKVILCSGKVYYDLYQSRLDKKIKDVAILRIEQLYPFPTEALSQALLPYKNVKGIVWCQEEPQNQGAWYGIKHTIESCLTSGQQLTYAGRSASASPATGYTSLHLDQQQALVQEALNL